MCFRVLFAMGVARNVFSWRMRTNSRVADQVQQQMRCPRLDNVEKPPSVELALRLQKPLAPTKYGTADNIGPSFLGGVLSLHPARKPGRRLSTTRRELRPRSPCGLHPDRHIPRRMHTSPCSAEPKVCKLLHRDDATPHTPAETLKLWTARKPSTIEQGVSNGGGATKCRTKTELWVSADSSPTHPSDFGAILAPH